MKAILISIQSPHACNILNLIKLWEIRKKFPKYYVGWVYIYCTKNGNDCYGMPTDLVDYRGCAIYNKFKLMPKGEKITTDDNQPRLNGKVVARFWCDKVEGAYNFYVEELCQLACINKEELYKYAGGWYKTDDLLAIHITNLEIFDKPKELSEFKPHYGYPTNHRLTRAPQSFCFIEI